MTTGLVIIQTAETVAKDKGLSIEEVMNGLDRAAESGIKRKYGIHLDVFAHYDRVTGELTVKRQRTVVNQVMEPTSEDEVRLAQRENRAPEMQPAFDKKGKPLRENDIQILLSEAKKVTPDVRLGDVIQEDFPEVELGRIVAQSFKQVIHQQLRAAERSHEFDEYKDMEGQVVSGIVKKADYRGVLVDLGKAEAFLPREETIQREMFRQGDRVRAFIYKVEDNPRGHQIWLSRTHPRFMMALFTEEVPEIQSGTIEIINCARDPGFRAKIAVKSYDHNLDPVGACVGIRGVRVQAVTQELQGERVDIINWSADPAEFLVRAMSPAQVTKVVMDEAENRMEVIVPEDNLSLAIGRRGQNVRLASILTGYDIDVMTEAEEGERRTKEYEALSNQLMENLDIDDTLARLLLSEGYAMIEDIAEVDVNILAQVEGLDVDVATELQLRANDAINAQANKIKELGVKDDLLNFAGLPADMLLKLAENDVKTLDDFADLATDELLEIAADPTLSQHDAERLIMAARQHWFADEDAANTAETAA